MIIPKLLQCLRSVTKHENCSRLFSVNVFVNAIRENIDIININFTENLLFIDDCDLKNCRNEDEHVISILQDTIKLHFKRNIDQ